MESRFRCRLVALRFVDPSANEIGETKCNYKGEGPPGGTTTSSPPCPCRRRMRALRSPRKECWPFPTIPAECHLRRMVHAAPERPRPAFLKAVVGRLPRVRAGPDVRDRPG